MDGVEVVGKGKRRVRAEAIDAYADISSTGGRFDS
jgi:hypothetical protein